MEAINTQSVNNIQFSANTPQQSQQSAPANTTTQQDGTQQIKRSLKNLAVAGVAALAIGGIIYKGKHNFDASKIQINDGVASLVGNAEKKISGKVRLDLPDGSEVIMKYKKGAIKNVSLNGKEVEFNCDKQGRLLSFKNEGAQTLFDYHVDGDMAGQIKAITKDGTSYDLNGNKIELTPAENPLKEKLTPAQKQITKNESLITKKETSIQKSQTIIAQAQEQQKVYESKVAGKKASPMRWFNNRMINHYKNKADRQHAQIQKNQAAIDALKDSNTRLGTLSLDA